MVRSQYSIAVACVFIWLNTLSVSHAERSSDEWLRGSGEDLQLCLRGEVVDSDGRPATDVQVVANLNATIADHRLQASVEGHRFSLWIPVNQPNWYSVWLRASSTADDRVAYAKFNAYQLRQAAIDGVKLTLQRPTRHVNVKVISEGKPVAGATVKAELGFGIELRFITDADGIARLALLPEQELSQLTAWTDDHRVGGFNFNRSPPRDPDAHEHVIELSKCRDQKVRFVTEDGSPVSGLRFLLQIATPSPNYNFIGLTDHSETTTDSAGKAACQWFPDWDDVFFYADIDESKWVLMGEPKMSDGVATLTVKERAPRKHIIGRVVSEETDTSVAGFYVSLRSFQGERESHSDIDTAFTEPDGTFTVDVLPDATYCAYVLDERWVGTIIDVLARESNAYKLTPLQLTVADGQPVDVIVTSGPKKQPVANLTVSFRREHRYTWFENGEERTGIGGPQWWATTDQSGKATTRTLPGKLAVSIHTPLWRTEESMEVVAGKPARITLHRNR